MGSRRQTVARERVEALAQTFYGRAVHRSVGLGQAVLAYRAEERAHPRWFRQRVARQPPVIQPSGGQKHFETVEHRCRVGIGDGAHLAQGVERGPLLRVDVRLAVQWPYPRAHAQSPCRWRRTHGPSRRADDLRAAYLGGQAETVVLRDASSQRFDARAPHGGIGNGVRIGGAGTESGGSRSVVETPAHPAQLAGFVQPGKRRRHCKRV